MKRSSSFSLGKINNRNERKNGVISSPNSRHAKQLNLEVLLGGFLYGKKKEKVALKRRILKRNVEKYK